MTIQVNDLWQLIGVNPEDLASPRYACRVNAALYANHFVKRGGAWQYIGSHTPAEALVSAASAIPHFEDVQDDREWRQMEGR